MTRTDSAPAQGSGEIKARAGSDTWETIRTVVVALLIALVVRTVLFQPYTIPSASEEPNLYQGDYIVVSKWSYGYSRHSILGSPPLPHGRLFFTPPKRGDVVVFKLPRDGHTDYIKRLVGLPGDRMQVRDAKLYINGKPVGMGAPKPVTLTDEDIPAPGLLVKETNPEGRSYVTQYHGPGQGGADNTGVYIVPQHCYFMMGDNRQNSADSRFDPGFELSTDDPKLGGCGWDRSLDAFVARGEGVGFVPEENLVGRARIVMLSWNKGASIFKPWTWLNLRWDRFVHPIH
ncbi:MAG TPA: signal peptidase I [Caulobacteraceae bacterium]|jgi:signal peptidase I|nr:signal peptidase I [Caulobacteraceae bacterium]